MKTAIHPIYQSASAPPAVRIRFGRLWLLGWLAVGAALVYIAAPKQAQPTLASIQATPVVANQQSSATAARPLLKPIEQIRVGERVLGENPLLDAAASDVPEPNAATWRQLELRMAEPGGKQLDIVMLRPLEWIEGRGAKVGGTIDLDLPEMSASGSADVLAIRPCPTIQSGAGHVVTATFAHDAVDNLLNLYVEGLEKPIGCTLNHAFWSEDRQDFVPAESLRIGERLRTETRGVVSLAAVTKRPGEARVYNLEVHLTHVYRVSAQGKRILVG